MSASSSGSGVESGSTRQWCIRGKPSHSPASTQFVVMVCTASSRQAPKPGPPMPYWQKTGSSNRFAVDRTLSGCRSGSVSGTRFTKTGVPATSSRADFPPMPEPIGSASSTSSCSARSLHRASDVETALWAMRRASRDMSEHFTAAST